MDKEILGAAVIGGVIGGAIATCLPKAMKYEQEPQKLLEKFKDDDDDDIIEPESIEAEDLGGDELE
mgnify:CR=1 FL=1